MKEKRNDISKYLRKWGDELYLSIAISSKWTLNAKPRNVLGVGKESYSSHDSHVRKAVTVMVALSTKIYAEQAMLHTGIELAHEA